MHTDPDYSAAYVVLRTDADDGIEGHGLTFTTGRGTEVCVAAVRALEPLVVGRTLESISADMRGFWRSLASDTQLRWLGPGEGRHPPRHGRRRQRRLGSVGEARRASRSGSSSRDMAPEELVSCVDFRYIADALAPEEAVDLLRDARRGAAARERGDRRLAAIRPTRRRRAGSATGTTRSSRSSREALAAGFTHVKMKVGADLESDDRRAASDPPRARPGRRR